MLDVIYLNLYKLVAHDPATQESRIQSYIGEIGIDEHAMSTLGEFVDSGCDVDSISKAVKIFDDYLIGTFTDEINDFDYSNKKDLVGRLNLVLHSQYDRDGDYLGKVCGNGNIFTHQNLNPKETEELLYGLQAKLMEFKEDYVRET